MINKVSMWNRCFGMQGLLFIGLLALSLGCDTADPDGRISVSGTVNWKGEPVEAGYIMFVSTSGGKSSGGKIVDGTFDLPVKKGIQQGKYKVKITANRPSGKKIPDSDYPDQMIDEIEQYIPKLYNEKTELTLEVNGSLEPLSYDLKAG